MGCDADEAYADEAYADESYADESYAGHMMGCCICDMFTAMQ